MTSLLFAIIALLGGCGTWQATYIADGDTIDVSNQVETITVRILGIDTPERGQPFYDEATAAMTDLVSGQDLRLVSGPVDKGIYGRSLRFVERVSDGVDVGAALISLGLARAFVWDGQTNARTDQYAQLEADARRAGVGMWVSPGPSIAQATRLGQP